MVKMGGNPRAPPHGLRRFAGGDARDRRTVRRPRRFAVGGQAEFAGRPMGPWFPRFVLNVEDGYGGRGVRVLL